MLKKIIIKGMSCSHCVNHVRQALSELKDSQKVEVNLEQKYAIVETSSNDEEIKEKMPGRAISRAFFIFPGRGIRYKFSFAFHLLQVQ